jgi:sigma-B regulation protein RsbU (phosphoserine phosphatase)
MVDGLRQRDHMQRSLEVAREVQQNLLPQTMPVFEGLDIVGRSIYCDETGGDYFDFIEFDQTNQKRVDVVIGDVSGHGISSALLMATTRAFLRQRAALPGTAADIISDVNQQLTRDVANTGSFMSMLYMTIDKPGKCLRWVRAGHDPAIFYDPQSDTITELKGPGIALGVDEDFRFVENTREGMQNGQIILLGTDGIWEARSPGGDMFGKDAVYAVIRKNAHLDAAAILDRLIEQLTMFQGGGVVEDDITLIVIKVTASF